MFIFMYTCTWYRLRIHCTGTVYWVLGSWQRVQDLLVEKNKLNHIDRSFFCYQTQPYQQLQSLHVAKEQYPSHCISVLQGLHHLKFVHIKFVKFTVMLYIVVKRFCEKKHETVMMCTLVTYSCITCTCTLCLMCNVKCVQCTTLQFTTLVTSHSSRPQASHLTSELRHLAPLGFTKQLTLHSTVNMAVLNYCAIGSKGRHYFLSQKGKKIVYFFVLKF